MPEFGFPAQPHMNRMSAIISKARRDSNDAQVAAVTGRPADLADHLDGRVSEAMLIENALIDLDQYSQAIALAEARAEVAQRSLDQTVALGSDVTSAASQLLTNGTDENLQIVSEQGRAMLESTVAALNARFAGRALFAGDAGDGATLVDASTIYTASVAVLATGTDAATAIAALEAEFTAPGGAFETAFYTGGTANAPLVEIAPGEAIDYSIRGDDEALRRILLNTTIIAAAYDLENGLPREFRRELLAEASVGLRGAMDAVVNLQGQLGTAEARIATVKARNIAEESTLAIRFNQLAGADQYEEGLRLSEIENQLETAFFTTARLSRLSLASYL